ncbi:hypothetical protein JCM19301_3666 [Jejuia pallidilutea]|uniref:Uncharacterized protein n=1 Tax=Jejuia pallidilutea TaxID=504487 RepID=A0A090VKD3_9FLAO|nr:hypothetical protein JCM19301_3666 [Jejuia pallidilutea]GAL69254.1 hypothetical protein JCM19302_3983 [Jejuia pallidilutea]GAL89198.1 hypothetical protein JCM19538_2861 [Jejuia pallidilutea]
MDVVNRYQKFPRANFFLVKNKNCRQWKQITGAVIFSYFNFELINIEIKRVLHTLNERIDFINE